MPSRRRLKARRRPQDSRGVDESGRHWDEASFAVSSAADWVRGADNKAGFALTALALLLGAMSSDLVRLRAFCSQPSWDLAVLLLSLIAVLVALVSSAGVVGARTPNPAPNRFSWPWLSAAGEFEVLDQASQSAGVGEAWAQARTLARIARRKHQWLRVAMVAGGVSAISFVAWKALFAGP